MNSSRSDMSNKTGEDSNPSPSHSEIQYPCSTVDPIVLASPRTLSSDMSIHPTVGSLSPKSELQSEQRSDDEDSDFTMKQEKCWNDCSAEMSNLLKDERNYDCGDGKKTQVLSRGILMMKKVEDELMRMNELEELFGSSEYSHFFNEEKPNVLGEMLKIGNGDESMNCSSFDQNLKTIDAKKCFSKFKGLKFDDWKKLKEAIIKEQKLKVQKAMEEEETKKSARREKSLLAYAKWLSESRNKPKPMPVIAMSTTALFGARTTKSLNWNPVPWIENWAEGTTIPQVTQSDCNASVQVYYRNPRYFGNNDTFSKWSRDGSVSSKSVCSYDKSAIESQNYLKSVAVRLEKEKRREKTVFTAKKELKVHPLVNKKATNRIGCRNLMGKKFVKW